MYEHLLSSYKEKYGKHKNISASLFSAHNTISLSRHEQVCFNN